MTERDLSTSGARRRIAESERLTAGSAASVTELRIPISGRVPGARQTVRRSGAPAVLRPAGQHPAVQDAGSQAGSEPRICLAATMRRMLSDLVGELTVHRSRIDSKVGAPASRGTRVARATKLMA